MSLKNIALSFSILLTFPMFSQNFVGKSERVNLKHPISYLDSVKNSFIRYERLIKTDSLWMNQLSNLDIYNTIETEMNTVNRDKDIDEELPTELLKQRLAEMDAKSPFNIEYNASLENLIKSFLKNRKKAFANQMAVAEYYFPIFEEALAKQNVPLEIKYLAIVESALNPKVASKVGATGLWQFMYYTGKQYDLSIDSYVDERCDPLKSSSAAAQYMADMYTVFNDWDLVLASYNSGPGNVNKAIRRSKGQRNFWNIKKYLPKETQGYVPAFLATMYIYEYHTAHGIVPKEALVKHFATDTIMVKKEMSFAQISNLLDISIVELRALNPSYKRDIIPCYANKSHYLTLPSSKVGVFVANEDKIYAYVQKLGKEEKTSSIRELDRTAMTSITKVRYYKVKRGDNLGFIAKKNHVSIANLKKWNRLKGNSVIIGKSLKIISNVPMASKSSLASNNTSKKLLIVKDSLKKIIVYVKPSLIVKRNTIVSNATNQKGNNLATNENILLATPREEETTSSSKMVDSFIKKEMATSFENSDINYLVKKGDSLFSISKKHPGVTVSDLKEWNNITNENLKPGMELKIKG